ncbi:hypothetical protein, partial [Mesorhizobium sp. M7A.F.Ca.CA.002.04.1.1]|uniref:hypothetical protein n=1 Tax=Mesorhizobium sp. M7A.F.Ca.CA.002.04.1.1 TaxID=2496681 RepID=UPI0019D4EDA4
MVIGSFSTVPAFERSSARTFVVASFLGRVMIDIGAASCCLPPIRSFLRWIFRADETTVGPHQTRLGHD